MDNKNLIGQVFFFPRGITFIKVIDADNELDPILGKNHLMTFVDLRTGDEHGANFVEEIGEEFHQLPPNYPQDKIDAFLRAAKAKEEANQIMMDVEHEILLHQK